MPSVLAASGIFYGNIDTQSSFCLLFQASFIRDQNKFVSFLIPAQTHIAPKRFPPLPLPPSPWFYCETKRFNWKFFPSIRHTISSWSFCHIIALNLALVCKNSIPLSIGRVSSGCLQSIAIPKGFKTQSHSTAGMIRSFIPCFSDVSYSLSSCSLSVRLPSAMNRLWAGDRCGLPSQQRELPLSRAIS